MELALITLIIIAVLVAVLWLGFHFGLIIIAGLGACFSQNAKDLENEYNMTHGTTRHIRRAH